MCYFRRRSASGRVLDATRSQTTTENSRGKKQHQRDGDDDVEDDGEEEAGTHYKFVLLVSQINETMVQ